MGFNKVLVQSKYSINVIILLVIVMMSLLPDRIRVDKHSL